MDPSLSNKEVTSTMPLANQDLSPHAVHESAIQPQAAAAFEKITHNNGSLPITGNQSDAPGQKSKGKRFEKCANNVTTHHIAIIQDFYHNRHASKENITWWLMKEFPDLRGGKEVDEDARVAAIRTVVELWCSMWATRHTRDGEEKLV